MPIQREKRSIRSCRKREANVITNIRQVNCELNSFSLKISPAGMIATQGFTNVWLILQESRLIHNAAYAALNLIQFSSVKETTPGQMLPITIASRPVVKRVSTKS